MVGLWVTKVENHCANDYGLSFRHFSFKQSWNNVIVWLNFWNVFDLILNVNLTVLFHSWCPGSALTLCLITSPGLKYGAPLSRLVSVALLCGFILTSASLSFLFSSLSWRLVLLNFSCSHCPPSILCYLSSLSQGPSLLFNCFFFFTLSLSSIKRYSHSTNF